MLYIKANLIYNTDNIYERNSQSNSHLAVKILKTNIYSEKLFRYVSKAYFTSSHNNP